MSLARRLRREAARRAARCKPVVVPTGWAPNPELRPVFDAIARVLGDLGQPPAGSLVVGAPRAGGGFTVCLTDPVALRDHVTALGTDERELLAALAAPIPADAVRVLGLNNSGVFQLAWASMRPMVRGGAA